MFTNVVFDGTTSADIGVSDILTQAGSGMSTILGWVEDVTQAALGNPLVMFTIVFFGVGAAIGILKRLISVR